MNAIEFVERLSSDFDIDVTPIVGSEFANLSRRWLECFCPSVKQATGKWVHNGYRWHAYSFNYEAATIGQKAFEKYASQRVEPFVLFHETSDLMFDCSISHWPDIRPLCDDIYIFPRSLKWTFITTHEMTIEIGPYFATRSSNTISAYGT